jgi:deoxyribose-phosphate aldolase
VIGRAGLAATIDHTLLRPEATEAQVVELCQEAVELGTATVCVSASMVATAAAAAAGRVGVGTVIGFPSGAHRPEIKALEARLAVAEGADEVDMVVDLGAVKGGDWLAVAADVAAVRRDTPVVLMVILESAALEPAELERAAEAALAAGADYLKTSTGFHPAGGATVEAVATLARLAAASGAGPNGRPVGVKASGGIRDAATALAMLDAGATRLGCSATRTILDGLDGLDQVDHPS